MSESDFSYSKTFTLNVTCVATSLTLSSNQINCTFTIGQNASNCNLPTLFQTPDCGTQPVFSIIDAQFQNLLAINESSVSIYTTDLNLIGSSSYRLKASDQTNSSLSEEITVFVTIYCIPQGLTPTNTTMSCNFVIGSQSPSVCNIPLYTYTVNCGSTPSFSVNNISEFLTIQGQTISVSTTNYGLIGQHLYIIKATDSTNNYVITNEQLQLTVKITCVVTGLSVLQNQLPAITHTLNTSAPFSWAITPIQLPQIMVTPNGCGSIQIDYFQLDQVTELDWIYQDGINAQNAGLAGVYNIVIRISMPDTEYSSSTLQQQYVDVQFELTLKNCLLVSLTADATSNFETLTYKIGDAQLLKTKPTFTINPNDCGYAYSVTLERIGDNENSMPQFITDHSDQMSKRIYSINPQDVGAYNFRWNAYIDGNSSFNNVDINLKVIVCGLTSISVIQVDEQDYYLNDDQQKTIELNYTFIPLLPNECAQPTYQVSMIESIGQSQGSVAQLSTDFSYINVDATNKGVNVGQYPVIIHITTIDLVLTPSIDMTFTIKFWCNVSFTGPTFYDVEFAILGTFYAKKIITVGAFIFQPSQCVQTYTLDVQTYQNVSFVKLIGSNIEIDTTDPSTIGNYKVIIYIVPQNNEFITPSTPLTREFNLKVFSPCVVTSLNPTSQLNPINRKLNDSNPTDIIVPSFIVLPIECVGTLIYRLFTRQDGTDTEIASFDESTNQSVNATFVKFISKSLLRYLQNENSLAYQHTYVMEAEVQSTKLIEGMRTASDKKLVFVVNFICTIQSITLTNTQNQYCHATSQPSYEVTKLIKPTAFYLPIDCPGVIISYTLIQKDNNDIPYDQTLIKLQNDEFVIDTQAPGVNYTKNYSWKVWIETTPTIIGKENRQDITISVTGCKNSSITPSIPGPESFVYVVDPQFPIIQTYLFPNYEFTSEKCLNPYTIQLERQDTVKTIPFTWDKFQITYGSTSSESAEVQTYKIIATQSTCPNQDPLINSSFAFKFTIACQVTSLNPNGMINPIQEFLFQKAHKKYQLPTFTISPQNCGATYSLELFELVNEVQQPPSSYIYLDQTTPNQLVIDFEDPNTTDGTFKYRLLAKSDITPTQVGDITMWLDFMVTLIRCQTITLQTSLPQPESYEIGTPGRNITFPQYELSPLGCIYDLQYEIKVIQKVTNLLFEKAEPFNKPAENTPNFFTWDPQYGIKIEGNDYSESWNKYSIEIKALDVLGGILNSDFFIEVTTSTDCIKDVDLSFPLSFTNSIAYEIGQPAKQFKIGQINDSKSIQAQVPSVCGVVEYKLSKTDFYMVEMSVLPDFVKFDNITLQIEIQTNTKAVAGTWYLLLEVFYQFFSLNPQVFVRKELLTMTLTNPIQNPLYVINSTIPVQQIQNKSEETIQTEQNATQTNQTQPSTSQFFIPQIPPYMKNTADKRIELRFAQVYLKVIDQSGKLTLQMMEQVQLINEGKKIDDDMLSIVYIKNSNQDTKMTGWSIISYNQTQIQIQLNFSQLLLVSAGDNADNIVIKLNKKLFIPVNQPYQMVANESPPLRLDFQYTKDLPKLMPSQKEYDFFKVVQNTLKKSGTSTMYLSIVAQLVAKNAMKQLWFYFNTMQLASTFTEFANNKIPANVEMVKKSYDDIIKVKVIPDEFMNKIKGIFGIPTTIQLPDSYQEYQKETKPRRLQIISKEQIKKNQITVGVFLGLFVAAIILIIFLRHKIWAKIPQKGKELLISIPRMFIWNGIIRLMLELFYPTLLLAMTTISQNKHDKSKILLSIIQIVLFVAFFFITAIHIQDKKELVDQAEYKSKYGAYFTNVETYLKPKAVHYSTIFLARRLIMVITIVLLKQNCVLQSFIAVYSSLAIYSWLIIVMPLDENSKNQLEMANEFLILILGYYGFLFTEYVQNPRQRYIFGYIYIGLIAAGLILNLLNYLIRSVKGFIFWWKVARHRQKIKKPVKLAEEKPELYRGRKSIFLKLVEGERPLEEDYPQVSSNSVISSKSIIDEDFEVKLGKKYENLLLNSQNQPQLITAEMVRDHYMKEKAQFQNSQNLQSQQENITQIIYPWLNEEDSVESDDKQNEGPKMKFKNRKGKVGIMIPITKQNTKDDIFQSIMAIQDQKFAESLTTKQFSLKEKMQEEKNRNQDRMEEAKREIVEGKNFKKKKFQMSAMVIESDSDKDSDLDTPIGTSIQEIDAYYNQMIAEFKEKNHQQHIENQKKLAQKIQRQTNIESQMRNSRTKIIGSRSPKILDEHERQKRLEIQRALSIQSLEFIDSDTK